jgi:uncharacterized protein DUF4394
MRSLLLALVGLAVAAPAASAVPLVAVTPNNQLLFFDSATPSTTSAATAITGLGPLQSVRGIDARPKNGELYAVAATIGSASNSVAFTYWIPRDSASAIPVGQTASAIAGWADVPAGWDFNPLADRGRVFNTNDENFRLNPFNGSLTANDTDLTPFATTELVAGAYDRNVDGTTATTLFAINRSGSRLALIGNPNGGVVTPVGGLGVTLNATADAGFDIAADGTAFAAMTDDADDLTRLYTVNLATGAATPIGLIGNGATEVRSLAAIPAPPPGPAGPAGPAGPQGPAGQVVVRDRLAAALASDTYAGRTRRRLAVRFVTTVQALVTLELRRGSRRVARVADQVGPGRARLSFARLPRRGRYTLRLTAAAGGETVTDTARLTVRR